LKITSYSTYNPKQSGGGRLVLPPAPSFLPKHSSFDNIIVNIFLLLINRNLKDFYKKKGRVRGGKKFGLFFKN